MRIRYKNKRDFYKEQMLKAQSDLVEAQRQLKEYKEKEVDQIEDKKKRYSVSVYCSNCMTVAEVVVPNKIPIIEADCTVCRVRSSYEHQTLFKVIKFPNQI